MTIKELYEKAVEGGYENLHLYDRIYSAYPDVVNVDVEIDVDSIKVEDDKVIFI